MLRTPLRQDLSVMAHGNERVIKWLEDVTVAVNSAALPTGGSTGQALVKVSGADNDVGWATVAGLVPVADQTMLANFSGGIALPSAQGQAAVKAFLAYVAGDIGGLGTLATQNGTFSGTSSGTNTGDQTITLTGDVTGSGTGSFAATIANNAVTNAKAADMAANTIKGNNTGGAADPLDLTATQATAMLDVFTSGAKGLSPPSGGGSTNFLRADGAWVAPPGSGGVSDGNYGDVVVSGGGTVWTTPFGRIGAIIEDQKSSGTPGGTFNNGADRTRDLNTEVYDILGLTVTGNQIRGIAAGTYEIKFSACGHRVGTHQAFLYNITAATEIKRGTSERVATGEFVQTSSVGSTVVTFGVTTTIELRHRCSDSFATNGFGAACGFGTEVYSRVEITRLA